MNICLVNPTPQKIVEFHGVGIPHIGLGYLASYLRRYMENINLLVIDGKYENLNQKDLEISWDLDQTLSLSEEPVKAQCDKDFGTNYLLSKRVDGWHSISKWLLEDGKLDPKEAADYESRLWVNGDVLRLAPPNDYLRWLSFTAYRRGIPQSVTTVRVPGLRRATYEWLGEHFWWISPGKINFKIGMGVTGAEFKMETIVQKYKKNPCLVHIDDDLKITRPLLARAPGLGLIGIKYPSDNVEDINYAPNRVFLDRDTLGRTILTAQLFVL